MARRRYQQGSLFLRGKRQKVWVGRWLEDVIEQGRRKRVHRSEVIGILNDFPTQRLARRELERKVAAVNNPLFRPNTVSTFVQFADSWSRTVLLNYKPSTAVNYRTHINRYLVPFFGAYQIRDITAEAVQHFVAQSPAGPKTTRNIVMTFRAMWKTARSWSYVSHDPFDGLKLPRTPRNSTRCFTLPDVRRIIAAASEPYRTFYWLAAETGLRAGELCGLEWCDVDLQVGAVRVRQSVWRGRVQEPKSQAAKRTVVISPALAGHLRNRHQEGPGDVQFVWATSKGTPWDYKNVLRRNLYPLLQTLGIERAGFHAFRHANATFLDQAGTPLKVRQHRLGHSDSRVTMETYTHAVSADEQQTACELGRILCSAGSRNPQECGLPGESSLRGRLAKREQSVPLAAPVLADAAGGQSPRLFLCPTLPKNKTGESVVVTNPPIEKGLVG